MSFLKFVVSTIALLLFVTSLLVIAIGLFLGFEKPNFWQYIEGDYDAYYNYSVYFLVIFGSILLAFSICGIYGGFT
jgi:hypothetical protein